MTSQFFINEVGSIKQLIIKIKSDVENQKIDKRLFFVLNHNKNSLDEISIRYLNDTSTIIDLIKGRKRIRIELFRRNNLFMIATIVFMSNGTYLIDGAVLVLQ